LTLQVETDIAQVRVVAGFLGLRHIEISRTVCGPRFGDGLYPIAFDIPVGVGAWRRVRASDMPELNAMLAKAQPQRAV
jgi:hypothetical protein